MNGIRIRRPDKFLQTPLHPFVCVSSANGNPVHHLIFQIVFKHFVPACDRSRFDNEGLYYHLVTLWKATKQEVRNYAENS